MKDFKTPFILMMLIFILLLFGVCDKPIGKGTDDKKEMCKQTQTIYISPDRDESSEEETAIPGLSPSEIKNCIQNKKR